MLIAQQAADEGLTLSDILKDIPHDVSALIVYALMLAFVGFIWYGSRNGSASPQQREDGNDERA